MASKKAEKKFKAVGWVAVTKDGKHCDNRIHQSKPEAKEGGVIVWPTWYVNCKAVRVYIEQERK